MTSRIIVNNIQSDAGISTIFFNSDIGGTGGTLNVDGNLNVSGVVTYDDVTNVDSVGVITARSGINVTAGSIGIGTDNPNQELHIHASGTSYVQFTDEASGTGSTNGAVFGLDNPHLYAWNYQAGDFVVATNALERLRITSTGKCEVYKGTSTTGKTSGSEAFTVGNGANNKRFSVYPDGSTVIGGQGTIGNYNILLQNDGQSYFGARMKIGTTTEGHVSADDLTVAGSGDVGITIRSGTGSEGSIMFSDGTSGADEYRGWINYNQNSNFLRFFTNATERLRIDNVGSAQFTGQDSPSGRNTRISRYGSLLVATTGELISNARCSIDSGNGNITTEGGMQAASVNLQSSSTASWFQTGANYGGADYVWAAKNSQTNTWHSGLKTTGDLYLGGDITGTRYIQLNGSNGSATFIGKVDIGNQYAGGEIFKLGKSSGTSYTGYYNGGTAQGFIGHADQLVTGGSGTNFAIRATSNLIFANGATESVRITPSGYAYFGGYPTTHTIAGGSPIKVRSGAGAWGISIGMRYPNNDFAYIGFTDTSGTENIADIFSQRTGANTGTLNFNTNNGSGNQTRLRVTNHGRLDVFGSSSTDAMFISSGFSAGTAAQFIKGMHSASSIASGTASILIHTNGNIQNSNGSYGNISDIKLKENIVNANSQWDDIKSIQIRNFNFKEETGNPTHTQIGVIAQEIELVSPGLVYDTPDTDADGNDLGTVTKAVSTSVLYMKAVKALQEAQTRIETLETQLTDALARITALEGS